METMVEPKASVGTPESVDARARVDAVVAGVRQGDNPRPHSTESAVLGRLSQLLYGDDAYTEKPG